MAVQGFSEIRYGWSAKNEKANEYLAQHGLQMLNALFVIVMQSVTRASCRCTYIYIYNIRVDDVDVSKTSLRNYIRKSKISNRIEDLMPGDWPLELRIGISWMCITHTHTF